MNRKDRRLGMGRNITRRDFIHDVGLGSAALGLPSGVLAQALTGNPESSGAYYPPTRTGLRGAHPGAFEAAHALARERQAVGTARDTGERYDLVVVGGGISGLSAAYFHRQKHGPEARILVLDNHDDFGGHAKRNEFHQGGDMRLAWGGTVNMEFPKYSAVAMQLLEQLGIDIPRLLEDFDFNWRDGVEGLRYGTWFDARHFGRDVLLPGVTMESADLAMHVDAFPLSDPARAALKAFLLADDDLLAGMSPDAKLAWAHRTSYRDFLRLGGVPDEAIAVFSGATMGYWGVRAENLSVMECLETGLPGLHRVGTLGEEEAGGGDPGVRSAMFPDGNASIARLLVRALVPEATPDLPAGADPHGIVTTSLDYAQLDRPGSAARIRLNSTVLNVHEQPAGQGVRVMYAADGRLHGVTGKQVIMACYNRIIPHLVPTLPEAQKQALSQSIKRPMLIMNVLVRNGRVIRDSGMMGAYLPGRLAQSVRLVWGVNAGGYRGDFQPGEPAVLQFYGGVAAPQPEGLSITQQHQAARAMLLEMPFEAFEREAREVLNGVFGAGGLDAARDVLAITVNRWPHGYARDHLDLEDQAWNAQPPPNEVGRQRFGNIAIANSDAGADAYTHTAIDQAWRAVNELMT